MFSSPGYDFILGGRMLAKHLEIALNVVYKFLDKKKISPNYALGKIDYNIKEASKFEIITSFLDIVNLLIWLICCLMVAFFHYFGLI